jgi:hypothetical protein
MIVESSPWNDLFRSSEPLLILSCCAPHVILHSSKTFLSTILKTSFPATPQTATASSPLRKLFGTQLEALASPFHPLTSASGSNPHQRRDTRPALFEEFYTSILTRGSGQLVTSLYDISGQSQLCLLHGYPIHNHDHNSPFDISLFRPNRLSDRSSSARQLSSVSLSSSHYSTLDQLHHLSHPPPLASDLPPQQAPTAREILKSGQILYLVVAVSPLLLMTEASDPTSAQGDGSHSVHSGSSHLGSASLGSYSSPSRGSTRLKRSGSDGTLVSQNLFLLYETERILSLEDEQQDDEDGEDGVYVQDDPFEGTSSTARPDRHSSTASWVHLLENNSVSRDPVRASGEPGTGIDHDLLNDL